ncbi:MAG: DEAD/DEAH box helicase [Deltaproteobacteria bacterium]|nr:DEAD/DEAH box helicase [Deltaproteobacteria bacterium]
MNFQTFNLKPAVSAGVVKAGFTSPTPIQKEAIPPVMAGRDVVGVAQTGTGKTAVFVLPILNRLVSGKRGQTRALIVAPTRELVEQIHEAIVTLGVKTGLRSVTVYGGVGINPQIQKLKRADIIVACPGRLLDHIRRRTVNLSSLEVLVLDEADHMFDMGFLPDVRRIVQSIPARRQTLLFSATMPVEIRRLADEILNKPISVKVGNPAPADTVSHALFPVAQHLKTPLLMKLLKNTDTGSVLVFTRTKHRAKKLDEQLSRAGYRSASLQGNLSQGRRKAALDGFRAGKYQILVATDIAARGIDVSKVSHVINYDIPDTSDAYIHRIGRTGRAERSGDAFTLVTNADKAMVRSIDRAVGFSIERRSLADFDYTVPAPRKANAVARPARRKPSQAGKGGPRKSVFGPIVTTRPKFSARRRNVQPHA